MIKEKVEKKKTKKKEKITVKSYIRDFLLFVDKKLIKTTGILFIVAVLLIALFIRPLISSALEQNCVGTCIDGVTLLSKYGSKVQGILVTIIAGIAPYIYAPIVGFASYVLGEATNLAYIIKGYGYLGGVVRGIIPLILNITTICMVTSIGIYICNTITVGYRISNMKNENFINFRIKFYEALQNKKKVQALTKRKNEKMAKLEARKEKINYLQALNVFVVSCILQFVSSLVQHIML